MHVDIEALETKLSDAEARYELCNKAWDRARAELEEAEVEVKRLRWLAHWARVLEEEAGQ